LVAFIQGALSAIGLFILGVPYALALGAWVAITSIIPYLGAYLGAIPAVVLALFVSPTTALLTVLLFVLIQTLEGNVLTPRIQGQTLQVPSVLIFLAVIAGGEIGGLIGAILAVPFVAMLRVLFDFFRARLRTSE
jgi:predicted PurR-regulated permease PerM